MRQVFQYHAFISYRRRVGKRVEEHLKKPLEKAALKIRWDEDFDGRSLVDQIENDLHASYKIVLVLTKDFLASTWCKRELELAKQREYQEGRAIIIALQFEKCDLLEGLTARVIDCSKQVSEADLQGLIDLLTEDPGSALTLRTAGSVLAIGCHFDDILLGCLGTLLRLSLLLSYRVDILLLCDQHDSHYYGVRQRPTFQLEAREMYVRLCKQLHKRHKGINGDGFFTFLNDTPGRNGSLVDRKLMLHRDDLVGIMKATINRNHNPDTGVPIPGHRTYNLILTPPSDDIHEDHRIAGRIALSEFRHPRYKVWEYDIKRYTERGFTPNVYVGLDEKIPGMKATSADEKVALITDVCKVTEHVDGAGRLFDEIPLRARLLANGLDFTRNIKHAEVFRGRMEL